MAKPAPSLFSPGYTPDVLWRMNPTQRKIDLSGLLSPEDSILAIARGMQPSFALRALEDRATIKAGLTVLRAAGKSTASVEKLKVTVANLPADDEALLRAAGSKGRGSLGARLSAAARAIKAKVTAAGHGLPTAAWGARGLFILGTLPGFVLAHTAAALAVNLVPVIGQVVSAAVSAHISITQAIAKKTTADLTANLKNGLKVYKAWAKTQAARSTALTSTQRVAAVAPRSYPTWLPWVVGGFGVILLGGVALGASGNNNNGGR